MLAAASAFLFCTWYPLLVLAQAKTFPNECVACVAHNKSWCPTYLPTYNTDGQCVEENVPCAFGTVTTCTKCPEQRASEELRKRCAAKTCEECAIKSGEVWKYGHGSKWCPLNSTSPEIKGFCGITLSCDLGAEYDNSCPKESCHTCLSYGFVWCDLGTNIWNVSGKCVAAKEGCGNSPAIMKEGSCPTGKLLGLSRRNFVSVVAGFSFSLFVFGYCAYKIYLDRKKHGEWLKAGGESILGDEDEIELEENGSKEDDDNDDDDDGEESSELSESSGGGLIGSDSV